MQYAGPFAEPLPELLDGALGWRHLTQEDRNDPGRWIPVGFQIVYPDSVLETDMEGVGLKSSVLWAADVPAIDNPALSALRRVVGEGEPVLGVPMPVSFTVDPDTGAKPPGTTWIGYGHVSEGTALEDAAGNRYVLESHGPQQGTATLLHIISGYTFSCDTDTIMREVTG